MERELGKEGVGSLPGADLIFFAEVVRRLAGTHDLDSLMSVIRHGARRLTGADGVTLVLRDGEFCHYAAEDAIGPLWEGQRFPLTACISGWAMLHGEAAVIEDIYADERIPHAAYRPTFVQSLSMVPIGRERPVGAIGFYWAKQHRATPGQLELQQALADAAAVGITNVALYRKLEAAREAAEAASVAKSAFIANVSHEIRTPLNVIGGQAYLLRKQATHPRQLDRLDRLDEAVRQLSATIADILDVSSIESGKVELGAAPLDVPELLEELVATLRAPASRKQLGLAVEVAPLPAGLLGDAIRLRQALLNYAANAVKFTDSGRVVLRARPLDETDDSLLVRFEVEDTGVGIAEDVLPRLFNPFEQADNSPTRVHGGMGLGLAITRKLAQLMGGEAGASSVPGAGSTFWFSARLQKPAASLQ